MKRRAGLLLCGAGSLDGTDPYEAVLAALALEKAGFEVVPLAINGEQLHVVDHTTTQEIQGNNRSMFLESARLVHGKLYSIEDISPKLLQGIVIPGGHGVVKSLLDSFSGGLGEIRPPLRDFLRECWDDGGVLAAISLAEFVLTALLGPWPEGRGCFDLTADEVLVDRQLRRLLTPGYTVAKNVGELESGISKLISTLSEMIEEQHKSALHAVIA